MRSYSEPEEDLAQDNEELNEADYQEDLPLEDEGGSRYGLEY